MRGKPRDVFDLHARAADHVRLAAAQEHVASFGAHDLDPDRTLSHARHRRASGHDDARDDEGKYFPDIHLSP